MKKIFVINSRGEKEPFSFHKIYQSARRVGASKKLAFEIAKTIEKEAYSGMRTSQIFKKVLKLLLLENKSASLKFNLKEGIRRLGPSGFPFEKYIGEIFKREGFEVNFNLRLKGRCGVFYEVDFLAQKKNTTYIVECKFHKDLGARVDLKTALMNYARFLDLKKGEYFKKFQNGKVFPLLVTNAKFTNQTIRYSNCVGQKLLGWKYPKKKGLERIIDQNKLYPITILPSLKTHFLDVFVEKKMMLAGDLLKYKINQLSSILNLPLKHLEPLTKEAKILLEN